MLLKIKGPSKRTESGANFKEVELGEHVPVSLVLEDNQLFTTCHFKVKNS